MRKLICILILFMCVATYLVLFIEASRPVELKRLPKEEVDKRAELLASAFSTSPLESGKSVIASALDGAVDAFENLSKEERVKRDAILWLLKKERLDLIFATSPKWVAEHLAHMESVAGFGEGFESSIAWGTGVYRDEPFYWYAYAAGTEYGSLQLDLSTQLRQDEVMRLRGLKPTEIERPDENRNDIFDVLPSNDVHHRPEVITRLRFNEEANVDWLEEFCVPPDTNICDTVGALKTYVLPQLKELVPEMKFEMKGYFPKPSF